MATAICPECGAAWADGQTCQEFFHQMLFWENEVPALGEVHHLMVLCYHLQHPSLYSTEGLRHARRLLAEFVEEGLTPQASRRRNRERVDSGQRKWSITARPGDKGRYERPPQWAMTAADVVGAGRAAYREQVVEWARSIHLALQAAN